MNRWIRAWGATALAWALVLVIGGAAIAGAGSGRSPKRDSQATATGTESPEVAESETPKAKGVEAAGSPSADNHGACVSHWVHEARDQDLRGKGFGQFVSSVAQSEETGEDCDFSAQLGAAVTAQGSPSPHGKSGEPHGSNAARPAK